MNEMMTRSKHPGDICLWVSKVIDSCATYNHINSANKLIELYEKYLERNNLKYSEYDTIHILEFNLHYKRQKTFKNGEQ
jgi:hypothetical protein